MEMPVEDDDFQRDSAWSYDSDGTEDVAAGYDPWGPDQENIARYGSPTPPDCVLVYEVGRWCGHPTSAHCGECGECPGNEHHCNCEQPGITVHEETADLSRVSDALQRMLMAGRDSSMYLSQWFDVGPGHPNAQLPSETRPDQLAREQLPEGLRMSRAVFNMRAGGWPDDQIDLIYHQTAAQLTRKAREMTSVDRDTVMARIKRMGVPSQFHEMLGSLPLAMLAQALMHTPASERFEAEPPDKTVLMWIKSYPNTERQYTYTALHAGDQWWLTGRPERNPSPVDWDHVAKEIGNNPCWLATEWGEVPQIPATPFEGMNPKEYFEQVILKRRNRNESVDPD